MKHFLTKTFPSPSNQFSCAVWEEYIPHFRPQSSEKLIHHFGASTSRNLTEAFSKGDCPHQFQQQSRQGSKITNIDSFRLKKNKTDPRRNTEIEIKWSQLTVEKKLQKTFWRKINFSKNFQEIMLT